MRYLLRRAGWLSLAVCLAVSGCAESVAPEVAPPEAAPAGGTDASLLGGLVDGLLSQPLLVSLLQRSAPLAGDVSASAIIGEAGGTISIPAAGFSITFPRGAVREPVRITATALAGSNVAYRFEPHGLVFRQSPVITQSLGLTEAVQRLLSLDGLEGAYFADDAALGSGTATVTEVLPTSVDLLSLRLRFSIRHFSGYAVSSGRGGYIRSSGNRIGASVSTF